MKNVMVMNSSPNKNKGSGSTVGSRLKQKSGSKCRLWFCSELGLADEEVGKEMRVFRDGDSGYDRSEGDSITVKEGK
jgi:hypothetical protein